MSITICFVRQDVMIIVICFPGSSRKNLQLPLNSPLEVYKVRESQSKLSLSLWWSKLTLIEGLQCRISHISILSPCNWNLHNSHWAKTHGHILLCSNGWWEFKAAFCGYIGAGWVFMVHTPGYGLTWLKGIGSKNLRYPMWAGLSFTMHRWCPYMSGLGRLLFCDSCEMHEWGRHLT